MDRFRTYLRTLFVAGVVTAAVAAGANYIVDPYGLFGTPALAGFNLLKPASAERTRIMKPYQAGRIDAVAVIGGNSRPELGLDPDSSCWPEELKPVFNAGIPGADVRTQSLYAMHSSGSRTTRILQGVDFGDFLRPKGTTMSAAPVRPPEPDQDEKRLYIPEVLPKRVDYWIQTSRDRLTALFSLSALTDSVYTVLAQTNPNASTRSVNGFNPGNDYLDIVLHEGQHILFEQKNEQLSHLLGHELALERSDGSTTSAFAALKQLVDWSAKRGIRLTLFVNPYHADYLTAVMRSGKWPLFEEWKRDLVAMAERGNIELWDFNTVDATSTEPPPAEGDKRNMLEWYWEPAHYRSALGEIMLGRMLGTQCEPARQTAPFGVRLTAATLDQHLDRLRNEVLALSRTNGITPADTVRGSPR